MSFEPSWSCGVSVSLTLFFFKEHAFVLKPLSRGLDIFQGENNCFLYPLADARDHYQKVVSVNTDLSS